MGPGRIGLAPGAHIPGTVPHPPVGTGQALWSGQVRTPSETCPPNLTRVPSRRPQASVLGVLVALMVATFCFRAAQNAVQTTLSPLGRSGLGLSVAAVGVVAAAVAVLATGATLFVGRFVPPRHIRWALVVGLAISTVSLPLFAIKGNLVAYLLGASLLGIGGGGAFPSLSTTVGLLDRDRRDRNLAVMTLVLSASLAVGPSIEAGLIRATHDDLGLTLALFGFLPAVATMAAAVAARSAGAPPTRVEPSATIAAVEEVEPEPSDAWAPPAGGTGALAPPDATAGSPGPDHEGPRDRESKPTPPSARWSPWRAPSFRLGFLAMVMYQVPFAALVVYGVVIGRSVYGLSTANAELGFTVFFLVSFCVRGLVAWRSPIKAKYGLFLAGSAVTAGGVALIAFGHGVASFYVALALLGVPHGLTFPLALAAVADAAPPGRLASANAQLSAATSLLSVATPAILGALATALGERGMLALVLVPVGTLTTVIALQRTPRRHTRPEASLAGHPQH